MRTLLLLLILTAFPALAAPLTEYLQVADNAFRDASRYRQQLAATLGREQQFGPVLKVAGDYSRSLRDLRFRVESTTPPGEAAKYHGALLALLDKQREHAATMEFQVTTLVGDEARAAKYPGGVAEADYNRHKAEFLQFIGSIDAAESPLLERLIGLRQQFKPDFELEPAREKPGSRR